METNVVTAEQVKQFKLLDPLLDSLYREFQELSKKKASEPVSKSKVKIVNRVLQPILALLQEEPQREFLNLLDDDELPENSDVVLMLGQFRAAMNSFETTYGGRSLNGWRTAK